MIEIDATVVVDREFKNGYWVESARWVGGRYAGVSKKLMKDFDPALVQRDGDILHMPSGIDVRIVEFDESRQCYIIERVERIPESP